MTVRSDFRLYHGNDLELLAGLLAAELARPVAGRGLLAPDTVLVPQPAMRRWLQKALAQAHGIAANLRFLAPGEFVQQALDANVPASNATPVGDAARLRWRLWQLLADETRMRAEVFAPLRPVLGGADRALSAWQLAGELAEAFEKYQAWRRDWLRGWDHGAERKDWQAELWRLATHGHSHRGKRLDAYLSRFDGEAEGVPDGLPPRVFAFACQNVSPDVLRVIASAARAGTLHFYFLSPVRGWWGDLQTAAERLRADPQGVFADEENPLLRANGAAGRDFVRTLFAYDVVHPDFEKPVYEGPDPATRTGLLHVLQRDLLERRAPPRAGALALESLQADASLQVHSCHTRLREVQVLHEQLRALLEADPSLQPREIAVLTPDIDQYAPFVEAVFGADGSQRSPIPFALADGSAMATEAAAEAFAELLALPQSRFGAEEVLTLLAAPALAERFGLEAGDFPSLRDWLGQAGARWGLDAAHRRELEDNDERAFSWAWALDRLLLGHAGGSDGDIAGVAPLPILEAGQLAMLDRFMQGLRRLAHWQRALANPRPPADWAQALAQLLGDFFPERAHAAADRQAIDGLRALVARFGKQAQEAQMEAPVPASVMRAWFLAALAEADPRQPFLTGGVTFGRMVPMRLVPFKVICLLGMNDGEFPRREPPGSLNRLVAALEGGARRPGDRSVREDDRGLFLQLLAAATQSFYLSYLGQDPRSGETLPPSVVVSELLDVASRYFAAPERAREAMTVVEPLQPFSPAAFGGGEAPDPRRVGFQGAWRAGAAAALGPRARASPFASELPPPQVAVQSEWTREQLLRALSNPAREFLSERLGLRLAASSERMPESEPFALDDGLDRWQRDGRVLDLCLAQPELDEAALARRLLAEGRIAPGAAGRAALARSLDAIAPALNAWRGDPRPVAPLPYTLELGDFRLNGVLPRVHPDGLRQFTASKAHGKTLLALGLDALVWSALGHTQPIDRIVSEQARLQLPPLPPAQARAKLLELLEFAVRARREALPFMPKAGLEFARIEDAAKAQKKAGDAWDGEFGEGRDAWVGMALRGAEPFVDAEATLRFARLARALFDGLPGVAAGADEAEPEAEDD
jgi:exodeoxyribonuclease V gamma subunit